MLAQSKSSSAASSSSSSSSSAAASQPLPAIICLMGPTAVGKSELAIALTQQYPCEIISVDSVLVYRGMNIGAAKPEPAILKRIPHHLIDIADPSDVYSAGRFRVDALQLIQDIHGRKKIPLLVGGTMMYFRILQHGLAQLPAANTTLRAELKARANAIGWKDMHAELAKHDPTSAARIHEHDHHRIMRALEVYFLTGKTIDDHQHQSTQSLAARYQIYNFILTTDDRARLHQRIATRFDAMLKRGLIDEVKVLFARQDLNLQLPSIRSAGYAEVWRYLANEFSYQEMRDAAIAATRQLAKRQLTWLRSATFQKDAIHFSAQFSCDSDLNADCNPTEISKRLTLTPEAITLLERLAE